MFGSITKAESWMGFLRPGCVGRQNSVSGSGKARIAKKESERFPRRKENAKVRTELNAEGAQFAWDSTVNSRPCLGRPLRMVIGPQTNKPRQNAPKSLLVYVMMCLALCPC